VSYLRVLVLGVVAAYTAACASGTPSPGRCALIGGAVGGGTGALVGAAGEDDSEEILGGAAIGGALGAGAGYLICRALQQEPAPEPMAEPTPPAPTVRERIVLRGVNFDFDKSDIRPDAAVILDEAINILSRNADLSVRVEGHTDWTGIEVYNQGLSERRAESVRRYLVANGVAAERLSTAGFGETQPIATNETREGRALNRRVELKVLN